MTAPIPIPVEPLPQGTTVIEVTSELYRVYHYADGAKFRINEPVMVYILAGGSHRVVDASGMVYRPTIDFLAISWKPKPGQPAFVA